MPDAWRRLILIGSLSLASCASVPPYSGYQTFGVAADQRDIAFISLHTLAANPDAYNGKRVRTAGVLHFEMEDDSLFFDQGSYRNRVYLNSVGIGIDNSISLGKKRRRLSGRYAIAEGTFEGALPSPLCADPPKISEYERLDCIHIGEYSAGALRNITFLEVHGK